MPQLDYALDVLRDKLIALQSGGQDYVDKKIIEYKQISGVKPFIDVKTLAFLIKSYMISPDSSQTLAEFHDDVWKYLVNRSFECKLLEFELTQTLKEIESLKKTIYG